MTPATTSPADTHLSRLRRAMDLSLLRRIRRGNTPEDVELSAEGLAPNFIRPWRRPPAHSDRCRIPLADDLHLSQRRRKGFVGGIDRGRKLGDSPSVVTVRPHGGGRFDLTCSFRT